MPFDIGAVGQAAASAMFGGMLQGGNDSRQLEQQEALLKQQQNFDFEKMQRQYDIALRYWDATNYKAQVAQMKKAGLNPALMYSGTGQGGSTLSANGNTSSAHAPAGGREYMDIAALMQQQRMTEAQIKLAESQANKNDAEATSIGGVQTDLAKANILQTAQNIQESQARTKAIEIANQIQSIELKIKGDTQEEVIRKIGLEMQQAAQEFDRMVRENSIGDATRQTLIDSAKANLVEIGTRIELNRVAKGRTEAEINKISAEVGKIAVDIMNETMVANATSNAAYRNAETNEMNWEELHKNVKVHEGFLRLDETLKDLPESSKVAVDAIKGIIQAVMLKGAAGGATRNPIGFKP